MARLTESGNRTYRTYRTYRSYTSYLEDSMKDPAIVTDRVDELQQEWEEKSLEPSLRKMPESQVEFTTVSLKPIERLYTPRDVEEISFERDINFPGMAPYTRGIHPTEIGRAHV